MSYMYLCQRRLIWDEPRMWVCLGEYQLSIVLSHQLYASSLLAVISLLWQQKTKTEKEGDKSGLVNFHGFQNKVWLN